MRPRFAAALAAVLVYAIGTEWVRERWAWGSFQIGVFSLAAIWLARMLWRGSRLRWTPILFPVVCVIVWGMLQLAFGHTVYRWKTWETVLDWCTYWTAAMLALQVIQDPPLLHASLRGVTWFGLVLAVLSAVQMFTAGGKIYWIFPTRYESFVLGPFVSRNTYAAFIELLLPIPLWLALKDRRRPWTYAVIAGVMYASVIAGASRAGSILTTTEIGTAVIIARLRGLVSVREAAAAFGKMIALAAIFVAVVGWEVLWQRLQAPDPYAGRREMLWSSIDMFRERPVWGFGLGTWRTAYPRYAYYDDGTFANQAHNDWAQWAVEGGIPVLLFMIVLTVMAAAPAFRTLWGLGVISVLLHGVVDYPLQQGTSVAAWFFVLAALAARFGEVRRGIVL